MRCKALAVGRHQLVTRSLLTLMVLGIGLTATFVVAVALIEAKAVVAAPRATNATLPYVLSIPREDGAHPSSRLEWWRLFGHLHEGSRRFDFAVTFFRFADPPSGRGLRKEDSRWLRSTLYPATFAFVDEARRRFSSATVLNREALGLGSAAVGRLDVRSGSWFLTGTGRPGWRAHQFRLHVATTGTVLDLVQVPTKRPVLLGLDDTLQTGSCAQCLAHAYAYTRLSVRGSATIQGRRYVLSGLSWLDHEFGTRELARDDVGWDRFAIQLDDGRDLLLSVVRRRDGSRSPASGGLLVESNGRSRRLRASDFTLQNPLATHFNSPHSGASYPSLWELFVPAANLDLAVVPSVIDQEIQTQRRGAAYFEGAVDVERAPPPGGDRGFGFVELTGYAKALSL